MVYGSRRRYEKEAGGAGFAPATDRRRRVTDDSAPVPRRPPVLPKAPPRGRGLLRFFEVAGSLSRPPARGGQHRLSPCRRGDSRRLEGKPHRGGSGSGRRPGPRLRGRDDRCKGATGRGQHLCSVLAASVRRLVTDRLTGPSAAVPFRPLGTFQAASRFVLRHSLR